MASNKGFRSVKYKEAQRFLKSVGAKNQCPVCNKNEEWLYLPDMEESEGMLPIGQADQKQRSWPGTPRFIPVLYVICDNCGYVRSHALFKIEEWLTKEGNE